MIACMTNHPTVESEIFAPSLLNGQVALVTGGGTGLGKATAHELARCGATVVIAGRRAEVLEGAVAEIGACRGLDRGGHPRARGRRAAGGDRAGASRQARPAREQRGRPVLHAGGGDRGEGLAGGVAAERRRNAEHGRSGVRAGAGAGRERDDRERDAVPPPRHAGHGPLRRGPRRGRGADARTGAYGGRGMASL